MGFFLRKKKKIKSVVFLCKYKEKKYSLFFKNIHCIPIDAFFNKRILIFVLLEAGD